MNTKAYIFAALGLIATAACQKEPEYDYSWLEEFNAETPEEIRDFNEKYRLEMTNDILKETYVYNGDTSLETEYTEGTATQCREVADFLEKEIFPLFPEGFIAENLPARIFVADRVLYSYNSEFRDHDGKKPITVFSTGKRPLFGDIGSKHLTLASSALERDRDSLVFEWTSLLLERMMHNVSRWNVPVDFTGITDRQYKEYIPFGYDDFYSESLTEHSSTIGQPNPIEPGKFKLWAFCGCIRPVRYGFDILDHQTQAFIDSMGGGAVSEKKYYYKQTMAIQDLADHIAFIITTTKEQKDKFFESLVGLTHTVSWASEGNVERTLTISREVFEAKMKAASDYMLGQFGWKLKEPENN